MKHFIATHTFKSPEKQQQYFEFMKAVSSEQVFERMTNENAKLIQSWSKELTGKFFGEQQNMIMFGHWEAKSENDIKELLGNLNDYFETFATEVDIFFTRLSK